MTSSTTSSTTSRTTTSDVSALSGLLDVVAADPSLARALEHPTTPTLDLTGPAGMRPFVVASLVRLGRTVLAVTATGREAEDLVSALGCLVDPDQVVLYPSWETLPHERLSPRADTVGRRLAVLRRLAHPREDDPATGPVQVVVCPVRSVLQPQVPGLGDLEPVQLVQGTDVDGGLDAVVERLVEISYARVDLVEKRGEFAVRGGILDVFPPTEEHPVRVELWGDTVEEVRWFKVADQRSLEVAPHGLWAPPCRELLLTPSVREKARALAADHPELAEICVKIADGTPVEGMEALAPVLVDDLRLLLDELPEHTSVVVCDPEKVRTRAHDLVRTSQEFLEASWQTAAVGGAAPVDLGAAAYRSLLDVREHAGALGLPWWSLSPFTADEDLEDDAVVLAAPPARRLPGRDRAGRRRRPPAVVRGLARRPVGRGPRHRRAPPGGAAHGRRPRGARRRLRRGPRDGGAGLPRHRLLQRAAQDAGAHRVRPHRHARHRAARTRPSGCRAGGATSSTRSPCAPATPSCTSSTASAATSRWCSAPCRAPRASTWCSSTRRARRATRATGSYVPTDQLELVTRYVGGEAPSLDKMGGGDWAKRKGRAKKAVREIAAGLIQLYAARTSAPGHAFGPDTPWQRELEDAFPYVETPDQLEAINEVKADMEKPQPMDRVIMGDVGYGKTEIAVRAAFKAVQDGKQVAVLVPTTLLVQQHYGTFRDRFAQFPVTVRATSRFNSAKEQAEVLAGMKDGTVDVVIGTHRLLGKGVEFKDLGLVIVDEEQRFGVEHKEHLKQMRTAVDVLTMSATPIPRTLEMSLTGIREMSTILTPPEERHPVLTFVGPYDEKQVAAAIRRELLREGQVFYLHNRVESIDRAAKRLARAGARGAHRDRPRADDRGGARAGHGRVLGEGLRRPRQHHDRRERPRHPERQHPHRRAGRRVRADASCTRSAGASAAGASARTPTSPTRPRSR